MGRIPTREALDKLGIDLHSLLCPRCEKEVESINHAFFWCDEVNKIWQEAARWSINFANIGSVEELLEFSNGGETSGNRPRFWKEVAWSLIYLIWSQRNNVV